MRKTNLLKGVVCGLLFTVVASSAVFGKTRTVVEEKGLWITEIKDYLVGTVGKYEYTVTKKDTNLITTNTSTSSRLYRADAGCYNLTTGRSVAFYADSEILAKTGKLGAGITRNYGVNGFRYVSSARGYYGTHETTGIADSYSYTFYQK